MKYDLDRCQRQMALLGFQQKEVAEHAGYSESAISKFFRRLPVRITTVHAIAKALKLEMKDIIIDDEEPPRRSTRSNHQDKRSVM